MQAGKEKKVLAEINMGSHLRHLVPAHGTPSRTTNQRLPSRGGRRTADVIWSF
jgi:hypothetical protein